MVARIYYGKPGLNKTYSQIPDFADRLDHTTVPPEQLSRFRRFTNYLGTANGLDRVTDIGCLVLTIALCTLLFAGLIE